MRGGRPRRSPLYERTLADRERLLGADHPDTLSRGTTSRGPTGLRGGRPRRSPLYERTLADCERVLGADHPNTNLVRGNLPALIGKPTHGNGR